MFGAVKGNRVATSLTFKVLEQKRLAVVLGLTIGTAVFDLLDFVPQPRLNNIIVVVVELFALVDHTAYVERVIQDFFPLGGTDNNRLFGTTA
ncbi:MAG: hypothetical protein ACREGJ_05125 [Candidatus Saccharimonadales bacterium]